MGLEFVCSARGDLNPSPLRQFGGLRGGGGSLRDKKVKSSALKRITLLFMEPQKGGKLGPESNVSFAPDTK